MFTKKKYDSQFDSMTKMPVEKLILILGLPSTVSVMITHIYNLVDTYFVSQIGTSASGAIGIIFGLMAVIQAFGFMFGQGSGNIISRMLGAKQDNEANIVASTAIISSFSVGLIITILGLLNINPLLFLLGSTDTIPFAVIIYRKLGEKFSESEVECN